MATLTILDFPDEPEAFDITAQAEFVPADDVNGDVFPNQPGVGLYARNDTVSAITLTHVAQRRCDHGFLHDAAVVVPAGFEGFVADEFENDRFSDDSGNAHITYSGPGLDIAAVRLHR